jgi:transcriptional regulator of acetoin/glycerol metabolism
VRELENALEYAVAVSRGQTLLLEDLPAELQPSTLETPKEITSAPAAGPIHDIVHIRRALEAHRWRRVDAARALGISRATLWRRMREAGLSTP